MHNDIKLANELTVNSIDVVEIVIASFNEVVVKFTNLIKYVICTLHYEYNVDNVWQKLE